MDVSVIICTYNRAEMLGQALTSLAAMETAGEFSYEIVAVDDASTDDTAGSIQAISRQAPVPLRYVRGEGKGVARARNKGIAEAVGAWIAFFDDDQVADSRWLLDMLSLSRETGAWLVGGRRLLALSPDALQQLPPFCRALLGQEDWGDAPRKCSRQTTPGAGNALIKRALFELIGGFDESMVRGGEDIDLFRRVRERGLDVWYAPRAISYHMVPPYRLKEDYLLWNSMRGGECFADRDAREWNRGKLWISCLARLGQAFLMHLPQLIYRRFASHRMQALGHKCQIWRAFGYALGTLAATAPGLIPAEDFYQWLEFRKERKFVEKDEELSDH